MEKGEQLLALYRQLVEDIADGYVVLRKGTVIFANSRAAEMLGYTPEEVIRREFTEFVAPERMEMAMEVFKKSMSGEGIADRYETILMTKEGKRLPAEISLREVKYEGKTAVSVLFRDITERKRAEEALERAREELEQRVIERTRELVASEERYRAVFEHAGDGIVVYDIDNKVQLWNEQAERILGFKAEEVVGKKLRMVVPDDLLEEARRCLKEAKEKGYVQIYETERLRKDGTRFPIELTLAALKDQKGNVVGTTVIFRDITQRKRLEQEREEYQQRLIKSERLAAIGQLASTVGHELRNPLGVISNSTYFLKMKLADADEKVKKHLDIIGREVATSNKIIADLLDFSRPREPVLMEANINSIIEQALLRSAIPQGVEVVRELGENLPRPMVDSDQMQQVFLNLLSNAFQAMPEGGRLIIRSIARDKAIEVQFTDTGVGIPEEVQAKIFDPLFTTKAKGVGLGLTVSKSIVERHGGTIEVGSEVGRGTTFTITLPVGEKASEQASQRAHSR